MSFTAELEHFVRCVGQVLAYIYLAANKTLDFGMLIELRVL